MAAPQVLHEYRGVASRIRDELFCFSHASAAKEEPAAQTSHTKVASTRSLIAATSEASSDSGDTRAASQACRTPLPLAISLPAGMSRRVLGTPSSPRSFSFRRL